MGKPVMLKDVTVDYPHLFQAREYKGNRKFSATFLFDKGGEMDNTVKAAIEEMKASTHNNIKDRDIVYYDGDVEYPGNVHYAGKAFIRANKNEAMGAPHVFSMKNEPMTVIEAGTIYRGSLVNASVDAYVPKSPNDDKICWGLTAVQHAGEGERITGENDVDASTLFQPLGTEAKEKPSFL